MCSLTCCVSSPRTDSDLNDKFIERSEVMFGSPRRWDNSAVAEVRVWWSGNLDSRYRNGNHLIPTREPGKRTRHGRTHSTGGIPVEKASSLVGVEGEPRLVRSTGMRRDWSFTDLKNARDGRNKDWDSKSSC